MKKELMGEKQRKTGLIYVQPIQIKKINLVETR